MKTAADIFDEISAHADHVMLSVPSGTPPAALLAVRSSAVASALVLVAAALLRSQQHAMACDLILLADKEIQRFRSSLSSDEVAKITTEVLSRANARAKAEGASSFVDPALIASRVGGVW